MKVFVVFACALACATAYNGPQHHVVIDKHGVPVDTVEVQHARAAHLAQLTAAKAHQSSQHSVSLEHAEKYQGPLYHGPQHIPVIDKYGVPTETPDVQHAKAAHLAASKLAASKSHNSEYYSQQGSAAIVSHSVEHKTPVYHGPQHLAVIGKNGVPVDTAEVQHARAAHLAVHHLQKSHY